MLLTAIIDVSVLQHTCTVLYRCTDHGNAMHDISNATTSHTTTAHMDMMKERSSVQEQFSDLSTFSQGWSYFLMHNKQSTCIT